MCRCTDDGKTWLFSENIKGEWSISVKNSMGRETQETDKKFSTKEEAIK